MFAVLTSLFGANCTQYNKCHTCTCGCSTGPVWRKLSERLFGVSDLTGVSMTGGGGVAEDRMSGDNDSTTGISTTGFTGDVREDP